MALAEGIVEVESCRRRRAGGRAPKGAAQRSATGAPARGPGHDGLLGEVRLPRVRHLDARAGAADLLLQLAARRLPALHRPRHAEGDRPGPGRRPDADDQRGRDPALDLGRRLLRAAGAGDRRQVRVDLDTPWEDLPEEDRTCSCTATTGERVYVSYRNRMGRRRSYMAPLEGVVPNLERRYRETDSE